MEPMPNTVWVAKKLKLDRSWTWWKSRYDCCAHRSVFSSAVITEMSSCSRLEQRPTTGQCAKSERLWHTECSMQCLYLIHLFGTQGPMQKRRLKDSKSQQGRNGKETRPCRHNSTEAPVSSQTVLWQQNRACKGLRQRAS